MKIQINTAKISNNQKMNETVNSFLHAKGATQCPDSSKSETQTIRTRGEKSSDRRAMPLHHKTQSQQEG